MRPQNNFMAQTWHGRPACYFSFDGGIPRDNCNKWHHIGCTGLTPTSYNRCCKPLSRCVCKACRSTKFLLILKKIGLLNITRKLPSDKQTAVDKLNSGSEEIASVVMSPTSNLDEIIKMGPIKDSDNKHTDMQIVTRKMKKHAERKQIIGSAKLCESTVLVPGSHNNT